MKRVLVFCEGPTEETFVKEIAAPRFYGQGIALIPIPCGGVSKYSIIKKRLSDLCKSDKNALVTTMLDYYGLPEETPGKRINHGGDIYCHIRGIEDAIGQDINAPNLLPNLMLHEFEALLFSKPECFQYCEISKGKLDELKKISEEFENPEFINNSPETAPSKRILKIYPDYNKVLDGYNIAKEIGIDTMRMKCRHFDEWMQKIEAMSNARETVVKTG